MFNIIKNFVDAVKNAPMWISIISIVLGVGLLFGVVCFETWISFILWNGCLIYACPFLMPVGYWQMMGIYILLHLVLFPSRGSSGSNSTNE